uniref:NRF domain-containing protein n=1 Tax=Panagrellus redivivus TaxID=6233 RepID=A0A7E4V816_PANRE
MRGVFGLILLCSFISVSFSTDKAFHYSLSESELRDIQNYPDGADAGYDDYEDSALGDSVNSFFRESNSQLILDLDLFKQFYDEYTRVSDAASEGDVDYLKTVLEFFEPLKQNDVSAPCLADIFHFLWTTYNYANTVKAAKTCDNCNCTRDYKILFADYEWIFGVVDAMGKIPAAIGGGNNLWLGSWSTCRKISTVKNNQGQHWNGQYCMTRYYAYNKYNPLKAFTTKTNPTDVCRSNASNTFSEWAAEDKACFDMMPLLNIGLCMPDTCTDYDVQKVVEFLYKAAELSMDSKFVCNMTVTCSNDRAENKMYNNLPSMLVLTLMIGIFSLMFYGTCFHYYIVDPAGGKIEGKFSHLLMLFSIKRNTEQLMDTSVDGDQIRCLHGARFLSMCWIIFGHTYYYICTSFTTDNLIQTLRGFPKLFYNQLVVQAPLAVDSFFLLSGLLTTYIFIKKLKNGSAKLNAPVTWIAFYIRRYLRLTPVYLLLMILIVTLSTYISDGPFWRPLERNNCKNSWWVNLLYLNNFFKQDDQCMGWTWYMANDFQLHCFAPILIIALYKLENKGVILAVLMLAASCGVNLYITLIRGYPPAPLLTSTLEIIAVLDAYWTELYVKPYIRCAPYIVGCIVGYALNATRKIFPMTVLQQLVTWIIAFSLGGYSVFGLFHYTKTGEISVAWHVMYTLFGRLSFSLFLGWIIFACETGNADKINRILGHKMFMPLSRMTFCAYLLHPALLQLYYLSRNTAFHFTHAFQLFYMFSVAVFVSYGAAFLFCLVVEQPVTNFDKLIFTPKPRHRQNGIETSPNTDIELQPASRPIIRGQHNDT